jgi:hypothetical protein
MPWVIFYWIVIGVVRAFRHLRRTQRSRGLCTNCRYVHMQYTSTGRNAVFCTFGSMVRPVQIDVLYCTDYLDRNLAPRRVGIGFAPEVLGTQPSAVVTNGEAGNGLASPFSSCHLFERNEFNVGYLLSPV